MAEILVIIVTYNGRQWTDRCLGSLRTSEVPVDVVVVDNGSSDGSIEYIRSAFPEVKVICTGKNLGFGQANNIGFKMALDDGYGYVYLLNQDAWIEPDTIRKLKDAWQPGFGILSPIQRDADGNPDANFWKKCGTFVENAAGRTIVEVPFVMAAHWLINRDTLLKVGGFSPVFHQYGEDDNYIDRLHYHGLKVGVVCNASAVHDRGERRQSGDSRISLKCIGVKVRLSNPSHCFALRSILSPLELLGMGVKNISLIPVRYIPELVSHYGEISEYRKFSRQAGAFLITSSAGSMPEL